MSSLCFRKQLTTTTTTATLLLLLLFCCNHLVTTVHSLSFATTTVRYYDVIKSMTKPPKQHLYYRDDKTLDTDDVLESTSSVAANMLRTTQAVIIPTTEETMNNLPSYTDNKTIARIVLSQLVILLLSTMCYAVITTVMSSIAVGNVQFMEETWSDQILSQQHMNIWNVLFLGCGGAVPLIHSAHSVSISNSAESRPTKQSGYIDTMRNMGYRNQLEITQMIVQVLGRRRQSSVTQVTLKNTTRDENSQLPTTSSSIAILSLLNGMTSISSELVYRLYLPSVLYSITLDYTLSILVSALIYGISNIQPKSLQHVATIKEIHLEIPFLFVQQTLAAIWYSMLFACSGSIIPSVLAHYIYDMDMLTSSWHSVNNQLDYIDNKSQEQEQDIEDVVVTPKLSLEAENASRRFFLAFDSEHVGSLNQQDIDRVLQYLSYNPNDSRINSPQYNLNEIQNDVVQQRLTTRDTNLADNREDLRLNYTEFVQLLQSIYRNRSPVTHA
jgi:Type II CAAX prenyl endopeptidase Rce1-like